jgi:hypothetical protein
VVVVLSGFVAVDIVIKVVIEVVVVHRLTCP